MKDFIKYTFASILGVFIAAIIASFLLMSMLVAMLSMSKETVEIKNNSILMLKLNKPIVERSVEDPLNGFEFKGFSLASDDGLDVILESIDKAKNDDNIKGIYLYPNYISAGYATVEEIRNALIKFKESGKFVYAYADALSQKAYYLVSVADKIAINPKGMLEFHGLASNVVFYKEALSKLGVEMEVIRHGKFKAAVEPFITDHMSPESRLQTEMYLNGIWSKITNDISSSRSISIERLNEIADSTTTFIKAEKYVENKLVDTLLYKDQVIEQLKELAELEESENVRVITPNKYIKTNANNNTKYSSNRIAVIYADGAIDVSADTGINSEELSKTIRKARKDSNVKAIVLRVNSPGGSAYGSEIIWREVELAKQEKPVVVSMGDYAASGGYYISCAANKIFAENTTLTGSIGIFAQIPNASELFTNKLGLTQDFVSTNKNSAMLSTGGIIPALTKPLSDFERNQLQNYIEYGYDTFISRVAQGRNTTKENIDSIGQGRVWAAEDALKIGLIDTIGTLNNAIEYAANLAEISDYKIRKLPELDDPFQSIFKSVNNETKTYFLKKELGIDFKTYSFLKESINKGGIMAQMPYIEIVE